MPRPVLSPGSRVLRALILCGSWVALLGCGTKDNPARCREGDLTDKCADGFQCERNVCVAVTDASRDAADGPESPDGPAEDASPPDRLEPDAPGSCGSAADCTDLKPMCLRNTCVECAADDTCPGERPLCRGDTCVACDQGPGCRLKDPLSPVCGSDGRCVECTANEHCQEAAKAICQDYRCVPCTSDAQCVARAGADPGVCLSHLDGRCASEAETIYVKRSPGCSMIMAAGGTVDTPYCLPQLGIDAVTGTRRVVVMRGPQALGFWSISGSSTDLVSVIGQERAVIAPGAFVGVHIKAGDVYVRGLTIRGGETTGVVVDPAATLRMNRCTIEGNREGGLWVRNAGFDITNTLVVANEGRGITFGGVFLSAADGLPQRFVNNTIIGTVGNDGLFCDGALTVRGVLLYNTPVNDVANCILSASKTSADGDPRLRMDHHLTADSSCRNAGEAEGFPLDDIDGEARPSEGRSDCGADEFHPR